MFEEFLDDFRGSISCDIDIIGGVLEKKISDPASSVIGAMPLFRQFFDN